jgi:hypothetical protein
MSESLHGDAPAPVASESIPRGQRFFDNVFLLLILGLFIMIALYTGWGMWEILTLPTATLP